MPTMPATYHPYGKSTRNVEYDRHRGSAAERGYGPRWQKASRAFRGQHPLCEYCQLNGQLTPATCVDHLYPHRGDMGIFWRSEWWVASCDECHNVFKQQIEKAGSLDDIDHLATRLGRPIRPRG